MTIASYRISPTGAVTGAGPRPLRGLPATIDFGAAGISVGNCQVIPIQPVPAQQFAVTLNNQACTINLYSKTLFVPDIPPGAISTDPPIFVETPLLFVDLYVNDALVIGGALCLDRNLIVRNVYFGFVGDIAFVDTMGATDPVVAGLGTRYLLTYWPDLP